MEVAGLALAIPPLLILCLDVLDRVESFRKYETHERQLNARFGAAKIRLQKWSRAVGVSKDDLTDGHNHCLDDPTVGPVLYDILSALYGIFDDVTGVKQQLTPDNLDIDQAPSGWRPIQRTKSSFRKLKHSAHDKRTALSWALRGKNIFVEQVEMFESLVDGLYDLLPLDQVAAITALNDRPASTLTITSEAERIRQILRDTNARLDHLYQDAMNNMYKRLDEWLKTPNVDQEFEKYSSARIDATCDWILVDGAYLEWQRDDIIDNKARIFWIHGPPGFGKTVLCATLIARIKQDSDDPVAYFFSSPHVQAGSHPQDIVRSWVSQLVRVNSTAFDFVGDELTRDRTTLIATQNTVWNLLRNVLFTVERCTLVLDGYDEFPRVDEDRLAFLQKLKETVASTSTRVLITSRPQDDIESVMTPFNSVEDVIITDCRITSQHVQEDVRLLAAKVVADQLSKKDMSLRNELTARLSQKSDGQFLWIKLLKPQLRPGKSKKQLFDIIEQMPHGLTQTYQRHWDDILAKPPSDRNRAVAILRWVCFATRLLTVEELTEALVHESDVEGPCQENMPDAIDSDYIDSEIKGLCDAFIDISRSSDALASYKIQIVHPSAREFLRLTLPKPSMNLTEPSQVPTDVSHHIYLAENCLRYINCDHTWTSYLTEDSNGQDRFQTGFMNYANDGWHDHKNQAGGLMSEEYERLTIQLFDPNGTTFSRWASDPRYRFVKWTEPRHETGIAAVIYLAAFWRLFHILEHFHTYKEMDFSPVSFTAGDALSAAAPHGNAIFRDLLSWGADPYSRCGKDGSPLGAAVAAGNADMVLALLDLGADLEVRDWQNRSILALACQNDDIDMMRLLLNRGADPSGQLRISCSPLLYAIGNRSIAAVTLLLKHGAKSLKTNEDECSHLHYACKHDCPEIVELLLLEEGTDVNSQTHRGMTPLYYASTRGYTEITRILLDRGANVDCQTYDGFWPLHRASGDGHIEVIRLLLDDGARTERQTYAGLTPLHFASNFGHTEAVCLLLDSGANIDYQAGDGSTPLKYASDKGHTEVVRLLLDSGANPELKTIDGYAPLHSAVLGNLGTTQLLLERGAEIAVRLGPEFCSYQPLHIAIACDQSDIAKLLIDGGAPVNSQSRWGVTALHIAIKQRNLGIIEKLASAGADLNLAGGGGYTISEIIIENFPEDNEAEWWKSMTRSNITNVVRKSRTRQNICILAQDLLNYVIPIAGRYSSFIGLYVDLKFLGAMQDAVFALNQRLVRKNDDGVIYHPGIRCDGCSSPGNYITGDRWACLTCHDRDYCSTCKTNLSTSEDIRTRKCSGHELVRGHGVLDEKFTEEDGYYHQDRANDPVVRRWLQDLMIKYGPEMDSNTPTDTEEVSPKEENLRTGH